MANSTNDKPEKPRKDFPLFAHNNGQWAKKIRGKLHYFGAWASPDAALAKYLEQRDYLKSGISPPRHQSGVVLYDLCSKFLEAKENQVESGDLARRSFNDYFATCNGILKSLGGSTPVVSLMPSHFAKLRKDVGKTRGPGTTKNEIVRIRVVFNWGVKSDLITSVKYGPDFVAPSKKQIRQQRHKSEQRYFTRQQVRALIKYSEPHLRAMILLGINCGWGNTDVASVPISAINLTAGMADFPRPKTSIERRAPLWPETVTALRESFASRRQPLDDADAGLFFLTTFGRQYVRQREEGAWIDSVGLVFGKLLKRLKIKRKGVNFYSLRHTFRTVADELGDRPAIDRIMGHETPGIGTAYREWVRDRNETERLKRVTDHVREWVFLKRFSRNNT